MPTKISAADMLEEFIKNEGLSTYQRKQIERIIRVAYEEGRLYEFRLFNAIQRNMDTNDID